MIRIIQKTFILFCLLHLLISSASAAITYVPSLNEISVRQGNVVTTLHDIENAIHNQSLIRNDGRIWYTNTSIRVYDGGTLYVTDDYVDEWRMSNNKNSLGFYLGGLTIENVTVGTWNHVASRYSLKEEPQVGIRASLVRVNNLTVHGLNRIMLTSHSQRTDVHDLAIYNSSSPSGSLLFDNIDNIQIYNITMENTNSGIHLQGCKNIEVFNAHLQNVGDYKNKRTGSYGLVALWDQNQIGCYNVTFRDSYVNGTYWSGIDTGGNSQKTSFINITVINAGHNGLDLHGGSDHYVKNVSIYNSGSNNVLITGSNIELYDVFSENPVGDHVLIGNSEPNTTTNITFENLYMVGNKRGLVVFDSDSVTFINATHMGTGNSISFSSLTYPATDITIVDGTFTDGNLQFMSTINTKLINVISRTQTRGSSTPIERFFYSYLDLCVDKASTGLNDENVSIRIHNEVDNSLLSVNSLGDSIDVFDLSSKSQTYCPNENRSKSPAILEHSRIYAGSSDIIQHYNHSIVIDCGDSLITLAGISPDSTWYRQDPNIPTYTITAIIPDSSTTGPSIIGFAPSEDNPFTPAETKKFRVWADETLTSMKWYVDGSLVASGSLEYN
ncbi:MAG: Serine-rich surface protein (adhesin) with putative Ig domain, two dockerin type 1 domain and a, partial [Clostridia bacterium]|nr:Serine-rich surface protein (adhesin) with putative Ig domain, two dockerin type 1 domain and a [Clostridia bacterium]